MTTRAGNVLAVGGLLLTVAVLTVGRERVLEGIKAASDVAVAGLLRASSQFGHELTEERRLEQPAFRYRRLRDLGSATYVRSAP